MNNPKFYKYTVIIILVIRGILNAVIPLMDKTEARYAEIARLMAETGNWITPQIDYGIPFWAKPPLSTWLSALSLKVFTINEFFVRLPSLLLTIILIIVIGKYANRKGLPFFLPGVIVLTIPEFLIHAGVVSTDVSLTFAITLVMLSFWESVKEKPKPYSQYLVFFGLGLGLLAKGPIVLILTLPPILIWALIFKRIETVLKKISLLKGSLVVITVGVPWYMLAEKETPGFIDYFVVGEHFKRFFDSSWSGDKYGFPKYQALGMIWVFLVLFTLPWGLIILKNVWKKRHSILKNEWTAFLLFWILWTPTFFTISRSLIHPYIMPVMIPIALIIVNWWTDIKHRIVLIKSSVVFLLLSLLIGVYSTTNKRSRNYYNTDKYLLETHTFRDTPLFCLHKANYSGQFYSKGYMETITLMELQQFLDSEKPFLVVILNNHYSELPAETTKKMVLLEANYKKGLYAYKIKSIDF
ncbi:phospholipid carrier-dependent glycosyltransferase [uncultured Algibacter sp.]|uniref:ArnT family glycosyltransferase n=1 Tax=uncultured Algibacter sp. TaxID=298659 RepID=UPI0026192979|nr:phospholipid carrier-dependent glycosyltransferase [uncultured Algibacter sp.]